VFLLYRKIELAGKFPRNFFRKEAWFFVRNYYMCMLCSQ